MDLGDELKSAREAVARSLQAIAEPARISATYLQKLERGEVGTPSPHVLRRLGEVLAIPYLRLMSLAGYLAPDDVRQVETDGGLRTRCHPLRNRQLTPDEWRAVGAFIDYLKAQRRQRAERPRS